MSVSNVYLWLTARMECSQSSQQHRIPLSKTLLPRDTEFRITFPNTPADVCSSESSVSLVLTQFPWDYIVAL